MRNKIIGILVGATAAFSFYRLIVQKAALAERLDDFANCVEMAEEEFQDICGQEGIRHSKCCPTGKFCHNAPFHEIQELRNERDALRRARIADAESIRKLLLERDAALPKVEIGK